MAVKVEMSVSGVEALTTRQINGVVRDAMEDVGKRWRSRYLPEHFKNSATSKYGYAKRKGESGSTRRFRGSYTQRKLKKYGHTRPLEFSGKGKREALQNENIQAFATSRSARVEIRLPQKFNFRHPLSQVRMADEIRATTASELRDLEAFLTKKIDKRSTIAGQRVRKKIMLAT